jgi:hypothetical protein
MPWPRCYEHTSFEAEKTTIEDAVLFILSLR